MRFLFLAAFVLLATGLQAGAGAPTTWDRVEIPPMKTSIYVGSVVLTTGVFERNGATLATTYEAKVFPWFFWSETGTISILLSDATLAAIARGETTDFNGDAQNQKGKPRKVTGRAYPAGPATGKIKVRIQVDDVELIFNGTYNLDSRPG